MNVDRREGRRMPEIGRGFHVMPLGSALLHSISEKVLAEERQVKAAARKAPKPDPAYRTLLTDAQVLEARALHEFGGRSISDIARRYSLEYGYARRLLDYTVRSKLIAKREHLPGGEA